MAASSIGKLRSWLAVILAVVLVLLALAMTGIRVLSTYAPEFRAEAERALSEALDHPLTLGGMRAEWYGRHPRLILEDVELAGDEGRSGLRLEELIVSVGVLRSLATRELQPVAVAVHGVAISLERDADGNISLKGWGRIPLAGAKDSGDSLPELPVRVDLREAELTFVDRVHGKTYRFGPSHLSLETRSGSYQLSGALSLPETFGERARFMLQWRGGIEGHGRLYLDLHAFNLSLTDHLPDLSLPWPLPEGRMNGEFWLDVEQGRLTSLVGDARLDRPMLQGEALADHISARFDWHRAERGWNLLMDRLVHAGDDGRWEGSKLRLEYRQGDDGAPAIKAAGDYVRLQDVWPVLERLPLIAEQHRRKLAAFAPSGVVRDATVALEWGKGALQHYDVRARFEGLSVAPVERFAGVEGVSGHLTARHDGGVLQLTSGGGRLLLPRVFRKAIPVRSLSGDLFWWRSPDYGWQVEVPELRASSPDGNVLARVRVIKSDQGAPFLDVRASLNNADAGRASRYLPVNIMSPRLIAWLDGAIKGGRVVTADALVFGRMDRFPFVDGDGVFDVRAKVDKGRLQYMPGWPVVDDLAADLHFIGNRMQIKASQGRVNGATLNAGRAEIADLLDPVLHVKADVDATGNDLLRFLRESPLGSGISDTLEMMRLDGKHGVELQVEVPFKTGGIAVDGLLELDKAAFRMPRWNLAVEQLSGNVAFNERGVGAPRLNGIFRGRSVRAFITTQGNGPDSRILLHGRVNGSPAALLQMPWLEPIVPGTTDWKLELELPAFRADPGPGVELRLETGLQGVELALPAPLHKPAEELRLFRLSTRFTGASPQLLQMRYSDQLRGLFAIGANGVQRAEVRLDNEPPVLPRDEVLVVRGRLPELEVGPWWSRLLEVWPEGSGKDNRVMPPLQMMELASPRVHAYGYSFNDVRARVEPNTDAWKLRLTGPDVTGTIHIPVDTAAKKPINIELGRLHLHQPIPAAEDNGSDLPPVDDVDPRRLPAVQAYAARLVLSGRDVGAAQLRVAKRENGLALEQLAVDSRLLRLRARGDWLWQSAASRTRLDVEMQSQDFGTMLTVFGFSDVIREGDGNLNFGLSWPGGPHAFALSRVEGRVDLAVRDGQLPAVEPGAGRVFGLMNLAMLPRRLMLDFSDLFGRGFAFSRLNSRLALAGGNARLESLRLDGPAARVEATGQIGLVQRDYDQHLKVTPRLSSALPLVGGLAGGPAGAVALLVTQKLLEKKIDRLTTYHYRVTGSWDDPKLERVETTPVPVRQQGVNLAP